jgi:ABC-type uncharacterized transport system substrate-binding protein
MIRPSLTILILSAVCLRTGAAAAHPHVWVTMMSELSYAAEGSVSGVRHHWTFDDMFSAFATQGLESKKRGLFTREELAPLAEVNVTSLKEYGFFTFAKGRRTKGAVERTNRLLPRLRSETDGADTAFHLAVQGPRQSQATQRRHLRPHVFC